MVDGGALPSLETRIGEAVQVVDGADVAVDPASGPEASEGVGGDAVVGVPDVELLVRTRIEVGADLLDAPGYEGGEVGAAGDRNGELAGLGGTEEAAAFDVRRHDGGFVSLVVQRLSHFERVDRTASGVG